MNHEWKEFYQLTKHAPPSALLVKAVAFVLVKRRALDLGAGALKDTRYLVRQEFKEVVAVDAEYIPDELLGKMPRKHFHIVQSTFDTFVFPKELFDLVNASYSLPFNPRETFPMVWESIKDCLKPGGIFTGQLFGINDEWNVPETTMTFHTVEQVHELLSDWEIIEVTESEKDGKTANGKSKHWHVFNIIVRKKV